MKVARRFVVAVVVLIAIVMGSFALVAVREESRLHVLDLHEDQIILARAVAAGAAAAWEREGLAGAERVAASANVAEPHETDDEAGTRVALVTWPQGVSPFVSRDEAAHLVTYAPVSDTGYGIRVSEPAYLRDAASRRTWKRWLMVGAVLAVAAAAMVLFLGRVLIARPVLRLAAFSRRIGEGDLTPEPIPRSNDELAALGEEMNGMCRQLGEAKRSLAAESERRIAALQALRHADRLGTVGQLAAGVAHELGTPLNVAQGRAQLVVDDDTVDPTHRKNAQVVIEQVDRMVRIIRHLLDFARQTATETHTLRPAEVVRKTVDLLSAMAAKRNVLLAVSVTPEGELTEVRADDGLLGQVLANLIVNAMQAMVDRAGRVEIGVEVRSVEPPADVGGGEASFVAIEIRDQGSGIAPENLEHVFEPFFTTKQVGEGTGLGLSVSYGIVRDFGGWIEVESIVSKGSCFTVVLPISKEA